MLRAVSIAVAVLAAAPALAAPDQIVVFGDSLVDAGNIFIATGGFGPTNTYNNPSRGYFPGRFTNGPDYTDLLSQRLYGHLSVPSLAGGSNYAFGGATYVANNDPVPDLAAQVGLYSAGHAVDPKALYIINLGGNDDFAIEDGTVPTAFVPAYEAALGDVLATTLRTLDAGGASRILVTGIPNTTATGYALEAIVENTLATVEPTLTHANVTEFNYQSFFTALAANPAAFDVPPITHLPTDGCFDHLTPPATANCAGYFSVDGVHPIAPIQAAIYRAVAADLGIAPVPEPSAWTLLVTGFGLIGAAVRRRTAVAA